MAYIEKYLEKEKKREEFKKNLSISTDYIEWLNNFTSHEQFKSFSNHTFLYYKSNDTNSKDEENVNNITYFYETIAEYANDNYIYPEETEYGNYFVIKYKDVCYRIGIDIGQGATFFCSRLSEEDNKAIDYQFIMSSVRLPKTIIINDKLEELINKIYKLYDDDISVRTIEDTVERTIDKNKSKKREQHFN